MQQYMSETQPTQKVGAHQRRSRKIYSREFKKQKLLEFQDSPLSVKRFCLINGLAPATFFRWKHESYENLLSEVGEEAKPEKPKFIPVELETNSLKDPIQNEAIILNLDANKWLTIPRGFHAPTLKRVIEILEV